MVTCALVLGAMAVGLCLGVPLSVGEVSRHRLRSRLWGFTCGLPGRAHRGAFDPLLFRPVALLEINLSAFTAAVLVLGLTQRGLPVPDIRGRDPVPAPGPDEGGPGPGMSDAQAIAHIIIPRPSGSPSGLVQRVLHHPQGLGGGLRAGRHRADGPHPLRLLAHLPHLPLFVAAGVIYYVLTYAGVRGLRKSSARSASEVMPMCPEPASIQPVLRLEASRSAWAQGDHQGRLADGPKGRAEGPDRSFRRWQVHPSAVHQLPAPARRGQGLPGRPGGEPAKKRELYAYRQKVGMIFQEFNLFDHLPRWAT